LVITTVKIMTAAMTAAATAAVTALGAAVKVDEAKADEA
jgi:hypothetical protein